MSIKTEFNYPQFRRFGVLFCYQLFCLLTVFGSSESTVISLLGFIGLGGGGHSTTLSVEFLGYVHRWQLNAHSRLCGCAVGMCVRVSKNGFDHLVFPDK